MTYRNITKEWNMYAVQGPRSRDVINAMVKEPVDSQKFFQILDNEVEDVPVKINRGGFSEYLVLPKFTMEGNFMGRQQPSAIKLDKSVGLDNLVLLEPFSVGCKAAQSLNARGKTAVVIGSGIIGMSTAIMLQYYGAEKVMIIDFSDFRLENARKFGILTCNPKKEDVKERLFSEFGTRVVFGGEKCCADIFVDCVGIQPAVDYFNEYAGFGATLCIVGTHSKPASFNAMGICFNQQWVKGCGMQTMDKCFEDIMDAVRGGVEISRLITHRFPIEKVTEAFETHGDYSVAQKVLIQYDDAGRNSSASILTAAPPPDRSSPPSSTESALRSW